MKVLVATEKPFAPDAVKQIRDIAAESNYELILLENYTDKADLLKSVSDVDALIVRSDQVTSDVIEESKNLRIVVRAGAGYDNVDLEASSAKNIVVMNTPGQNSNAVAELAIGMMVYSARGKFDGKPGTELKEKTVGIHAYGNVGKIVAKIANGFGMIVSAFDPFIPKENIELDGVKVYETVEDLYKNNRYISLHIPSNIETKDSINYDLLISMPKGATLINTARKEVIKEYDLSKVLSERSDFKYASDIAPDIAEELIAQYGKQCYFTPKKMGAQTEEANINAGIAAIKQIVAFFEKGNTTFQVNK